MEVQIKEIVGNWEAGYVLHKHVLSSTFLGNNEFGHPQFDTKRSEVGEALFQLKYRDDKSKAAALAAELASSVIPRFEKIGMIIPMPASINRPWQPVDEIAKELGKIIKVPVFDEIIVKGPAEDGAKQLKDITNKEEKVAALTGRFTIKDVIDGEGPWNALLVDDLFDTGASMEAATAALKTYKKIKKVYVAALTWK